MGKLLLIGGGCGERLESSGRNGDGTWKGWDTLGARETTWWSIDVSDSNYPWLLYHRRGDGGDSGISWTHKYEGWQVRCVRDAGK